ncbi:MAG: sigma 54-interacting transcriptional regulator, partial [Thiohalorhabdaceae bacterium]
EAALDIQLSSLLARLYNGSEQNRLHPERSRFHGLVGVSQSMAELYSLLEVVGPSDATVLIRGQSGTGKELVARAIHAESARSEHPFVAINCGAIPPDLLEAELFDASEREWRSMARGVSPMRTVAPFSSMKSVR